MSSAIKAKPGYVPEQLATVIEKLAQVARDLSSEIARAGLGEALGAELGANSDGDTQKALDVMADEAFAAALTGTAIRYYASEEQDRVTELNPGGDLALAIDPLDGSSNIDVNVSIGTIFAIYPAGQSAEASFLRPAREIIAGGYFVYGPSTQLVVSFGQGVIAFVLDPKTGDFVQTDDQLWIPEQSKEFAINASNFRHWSAPVRSFIDDCLSGEDGPCAQNFNMRWVASLVAETHRILTRGGIFLYPADARKGYERGRLRMIYECAPIAFLIEQAGGRATTGTDRLLDQSPSELHARSPLIFGSLKNVDRLTVYHDLPDGEVSALFGTRGLFRV